MDARDIVERLWEALAEDVPAEFVDRSDILDAVQEIERLRAENLDQLRTISELVNDPKAVIDTEAARVIEEKNSEIERLRRFEPRSSIVKGASK